ncbi:hypothetical protein [Streptomyces sp. NPDC006446]
MAKTACATKYKGTGRVVAVRPYLLPLALEVLRENPMAEGHMMR